MPRRREKPPPKPRSERETKLRKGVVEALRSLFPAEVIEEKAGSMDVIMRRRKLQIVPFFWTLVLGFSTMVYRGMEEMRAIYNDEADAGHRLAKSSFAERFDPRLVRFMREMLHVGMDHLAKSTRRTLKGVYAPFTDVRIQDSTTITLPDTDALAKRWPASDPTKGSRAALKVCTQLSVLNGGPTRIEMKPESTSEHRTLKTGPWLKGVLLLTDLGFFAYGTFNRIEQNGGFFISRLKNGSNPTITKLIRVVRGRSIDLVGKRLKEVLPALKRGVLDVEVKVNFDTRSYKGKRRRHTLPMRMVGILNKEAGEHHLYLTNVKEGVLSAEAVAKAYRARWEIECCFNQLKSSYSMDKLGPTNPNAAEALIWASLLTLVVARTTYRYFTLGLDPARVLRFTDKRFAKFFRRNCGRFQEWVLEAEGYVVGLAVEMYVFEVMTPDPNVEREHLLDDMFDGV